MSKEQSKILITERLKNNKNHVVTTILFEDGKIKFINDNGAICLVGNTNKKFSKRELKKMDEFNSFIILDCAEIVDNCVNNKKLNKSNCIIF